MRFPLIILLAVLNVSAQEKPTKVEVISAAPVGRTELPGDLRPPLNAVFNQPMVPIGSPEENGKLCPIEVTPRVKGRCRWQGTQMVSFEPSEPLPAASEFKVRVPKGTRSKVSGQELAQAYEWSFETPRPELLKSVPEHLEEWIDLKPVLLLQFNMPMNPRRARSGLSLVEDGSQSVDIGVRRATAEEIKKTWPYSWWRVAPSTENVIAVSPYHALKPGGEYALRMAGGLQGKDGELGTLEDRELKFKTWLPFAFLDSEPSGPFCLPSEPRLNFTNPIRYKDLFAGLSFSPPLKFGEGESQDTEDFSTWYAEQTGTRLPERDLVTFPLSWAALAPDTNYSVRISSGLKDVFGNVLASEAVTRFQTAGVCPYLNAPQGIGLLEGYLKPFFPVTVVNLEKTQVSLAYIEPERIIPFIEEKPFDASEPTKIPGAIEKSWKTKTSRNRRVHLALDVQQALGARKSGAVFVQVKDTDGYWRKSFVNVTRLGLTAKTSPETTLVWATFLKTGAPASGAAVELRDEKNKVLFQGVTDGSGLLVAPGWKELGIREWKRWPKPSLWVFARHNQEFAALSTAWNAGLDGWRFGVSYDSSPRPWHFGGSLFTERGVYRSGETVYAKGILRELVRGEWEKASLSSVHVTITDPRAAEVFRATIPVSELSSFDFKYALSPSAPSGFWSIEVADSPDAQKPLVQAGEADEMGEEEREGGKEKRLRLTAGFRVEPFKPASFEVRVNPEKSEYLPGEEYKATVDGWYLFGAPMSGGFADWRLRLVPSAFSPEGFDGFSFGPGWWEESSFHGSVAAASTATLDTQGKTVVAARLEGVPGRPVQAFLEATVTSPDRQRLAGRSSVLVHPADLYLGIRPSKTFLEKGQEWSTELVAVRPDGTHVAGTTVTAVLMRRDWLSVQKAGLGGRLEWVNEQRDVEVDSFTYVSSGSTRTWSRTLDAVGQYFLTLKAEDSAGRTAISGDSFYVTGKGEAWWSRSDSDLVELVPDKKSYKPGETARILVKSPFSRTRALVTVERETVLSRRVVWLEGGADFLTVPIAPEHAPNVYVGVVLLQGRSGVDKYSDVGDDVAKPQAKFGYASLGVDPGGRRLAVEVHTDSGSYRPGGEVTATVSVLEAGGRAVPAEVAVFAVDEGVLALTAYATPDPFSDFYGQRPLLMGTSSLLPYIIGQRSFGEKGKNRGGGGGEDGLAGIDLRSLFVPTAYWNPSVKVGPSGKAQVRFKLPDNLSRFRVMAVAHTGRLFGSGSSQFTVSKPLLLKPSLPRFARVGDSFEGGVVVHNYTGAPAKVSLELALAGKALKAEGPAAREVSVESGRAVEVVWPITAAEAGETALRFRARAGRETDGLEWKLGVKLRRPLEVAATSGVTEGEAVEKLEVPGASPESGELEAGLSATALSGLSEGARFLLQYPYGCLEQTMSRVFPVLVGADLVETFGLGDLKELKARAAKALASLPEFQHASGGYGYWHDPYLPDPWVTSFALHAAALGVKEGYVLDQGSLERALTWLRGVLYSKERSGWAYPYSRSDEFASRAYAVYALALHGRKEPSVVSNLFLNRDQLPLAAKAHLLKAAQLTGAEPSVIATLRAEILNKAKFAPTTLHFEDESEEESVWTHGSGARTTALALQALLEAGGGFPGDEKAVRWLIAERKLRGRWRTTQENTAALYALQDYYRRYEKEAPDFLATVRLGVQEWKEAFKGRDLASRRRVFPLGGKAGEVRLSKTGTGRLHYTLRLSYVDPAPEKRKSEGLSVEKELKPLTGKPGRRLKPGERAVVTLRVRTPQDRVFVVLDDPIPAGFEIVDTSFATESSEDAALLQASSAGSYEWAGFQRAENYDDRIAVFADYLPAGEHRYSYLVQATTPGRFSAPASRVEQMYEPEVFGTTEGGEAAIGE